MLQKAWKALQHRSVSASEQLALAQSELAFAASTVKPEEQRLESMVAQVW